MIAKTLKVVCHLIEFRREQHEGQLSVSPAFF